ncbi:2Fe-2S iron-sulfur cluster-binding protein [Streptomyces sp. NPDC001617]
MPRHGVTVEVPVGTSMLDALRAAGVEIMYDCLRGECGLCRVQILQSDGPVDHRDVFLSPRQRARNSWSALGYGWEISGVRPLFGSLKKPSFFGECDTRRFFVCLRYMAR